jgi:Cu/Ag efflux pump CusA
VIGGLCLATVATLVFVPSVYALLHARVKTPHVESKALHHEVTA